jgi:aubergine-like protein
MKDMANSTKKEPGERLAECGNLISTALANPKSQADISDWKVHLSPAPVELEGRVLDAGQIAMGKNMGFNINPSTGSFDRDVQKKMFEQPELKIWGIFHMENDKRLVDSFMGILQQVIQQFEVQCQKPVIFPVRGDRWEEWDRNLREKLNPQVQLIVCILPGQRGKSRLYDDLKRLTFSRFPVPTQCILNGTLKKDKGLRSVVNKVMIQINAKVGGVPWALKNLPCGDKPTMVVGIDVYHKKGAYSVLGFCATTDRYFSKYTSVAKVHMESQEMVTSFKIAMIEAITQFKSDNGTPPLRVIIFRDGVSDSQRNIVLSTEVAQIKSAFVDCKTSGVLAEIPTCSFLVVNKRINARFFAQQGNSFSNPPLGTCVDTVVSEKEGYDFYVTPAKATQGAMTPTHFHVIYDDSGRSSNEIEELTYRLCYSYYNWSGSIRVPAPCQYAHKLAYTYGERATREGPPVPHNHWSSTRSLYFL